MKKLASIWWLIALRGVFGILIGLAALVWPGLTLEFFILVFGAYILIEGIINTLTGLVSIDKNKHWYFLLLEGILGIIVGWFLFANPLTVILSLSLFVQIFGIWMVITGVLRIFLSIMVRKEVKNEVFLLLGALLSIVIGIFLLYQPVAGLVVSLWVFGFYAILIGILAIAFAMNLRGKK
jgi:uncharacterized membrane protein HdeD (DUF308 family)